MIDFNRKRQLKYCDALLVLIERKLDLFEESREKETMNNTYVDLVEKLTNIEFDDLEIEESFILSIEELNDKAKEFYAKTVLKIS